VILAHWSELDWVRQLPHPPSVFGNNQLLTGANNQAASFGVEAELIRFSVGLEDTAQLTATFESALATLSAA
jgi:O-acetylhomoserine/O-acetylserine sulfhydrylase-like pyridoxal-dependent enzyme